MRRSSCGPYRDRSAKAARSEIAEYQRRNRVLTVDIYKVSLLGACILHAERVSDMERAAVIAAFVVGIGVGALAPSAFAYTQDETRLMNQVVQELRGIKSELAKISSKLR